MKTNLLFSNATFVAAILVAATTGLKVVLASEGLRRKKARREAMKHVHMLKRLLLSGMSALLITPSWAQPAGGLRTNFGDVLIENLGIGRTYNLRDISGIPFKVTNTGADTVQLYIDVQIPTADAILAGRKEKGFKPIPSVNWVKLSRAQFIVPAKESAYTDVLIEIPNDPSLYGRKFQADIYSRTQGKGFLQLGLWSHLLITISPSGQAQSQAEKDLSHGVIGNLDYTLIPDKLVVENVPLGRKLDIFKEIKKTIKIANSGSDPVKLRVKVVPVGETPLSLQEGYEQPARLEWLTLKSDVFTVASDVFVDMGLVLNLPNDPTLKHKKLMFVLKVEPADPGVVGVIYYGKVYVDVQ